MNIIKRIKHLLRSFFISIEFLIFLFWFASHKFLEPHFSDLLKSSNLVEIAKWSGFLPCIIFAFTIKKSSNILRPFKDKKMKIFLEWPLYVIFKDKYYINILIQIVCIIFSLHSFMKFDLARNYYFVIILFSCVISIVSSASNYLGGGIEIQNVFDLNYKQDNK